MLKTGLIKKIFLEQNIFLILSLLFGILFIFIKPVFGGWDESAHYYKSVKLSQFQIYGQKLDNKSGFYFSPSHVLAPDKASYNPRNEKNEIFISCPNTVVYPPVPYVSMAATMWVGSLFKLPPLKIPKLIRFVNLLTWTILVYAAICIIPFYKKTLLLVSLMPMSVFLSAMMSADPLNTAFIFLYIALVLNFTFSKEKILNMKKILILAVVAALVSLCKGYILILLLFFLIPKDKFKNNKNYIISIITVVLLPLLLFLFWVLSTKGLIVPLRANTDQVTQLNFIMNNPITFLTYLPKELIRTVFIPLIEIDIKYNYGVTSSVYNNSTFFKYIISSFLAGKLTIGEILKNSVFIEKALSFFIYVIYFIGLVVVSIFDGKEDAKISIRNKLFLFIIHLLTYVLIVASLFLNWTPVGTQEILGVQSKYFIPILPILLLLIYNNKYFFREPKLKSNIIIAIFMFVILLFSVSLAYARYHLI